MNSAESESHDSLASFFISSIETTMVFLSNTEFQNYVSDGDFVYLDGHLVINDPRFVERNAEGTLQLTAYARSHLDECCLMFEVSPKKGRGSVEYAWIDLGEKSGGSADTGTSSAPVPVFNSDVHNQKMLGKAKSTTSFAALTEEYRKFNRLTSDFNFAQTVYAHIKRLDISQRLFSEKTLLDDRTYRKIKSGNWENPEFDAVMAICVGLALGTTFGLPLIELAGYSLSRDDRVPYRILLDCFRGHSIFECNRYLDEYGATLLREKEYRTFVGI